MALNHKELVSLPHESRPYKRGLGGGLFVLVDKEYTVGGRDIWDQTLSGYFTLTSYERKFKIYAEIGFNDNRMFFADLFIPIIYCFTFI